jgi:hypothetical protein
VPLLYPEHLYSLVPDEQLTIVIGYLIRTFMGIEA